MKVEIAGVFARLLDYDVQSLQNSAVKIEMAYLNLLKNTFQENERLNIIFEACTKSKGLSAPSFTHEISLDNLGERGRVKLTRTGKGKIERITSVIDPTYGDLNSTDIIYDLVGKGRLITLFSSFPLVSEDKINATLASSAIDILKGKNTQKDN